jgi:hypothetical protein
MSDGYEMQGHGPDLICQARLLEVRGVVVAIQEIAAARVTYCLNHQPVWLVVVSLAGPFVGAVACEFGTATLTGRCVSNPKDA